MTNITTELSALSSTELNSVSWHLLLSWTKKKKKKERKTIIKILIFDHRDRILAILLDLKVTWANQNL